MKKFAAKYFDGERAGSRPASIDLLDTGGLRLIHNQNEQYYSLDELNIESQLGSGPAIIEFPAGDRAEIADPNQFFYTLKSVSGQKSIVHFLESYWDFVLIALAVTGVVVWAGISYGIPAAAKTAAELIPVELDEKIGKQGLELLDGAFLSESQLAEDRRAELTVLFQDVVEAVGDDYSYSLEFRQGDGLGANALALPSGIVVLTDELVALSERNEEIAAVLAHEVGHARNRHTLRSIIQGSVVAGVIVAITGDVGSAANVAAGIPTLLVERSYSRDFEREADSVAFEYLEIRDISGQPLADLLQRIDESHEIGSDEQSILDTHPRSAERVR